MKVQHFLQFATFGVKTIVFRQKKPILGTIIVTDRCNLNCQHCAVNNVTAVMHPYQQIHQEMETLYAMGIRILFFCGGETFLWQDEGVGIRDLVREAKAMGFLIVNVVTNGTLTLELPEADLILLSLDGSQQTHDLIRGKTFATIMDNIAKAPNDNICLYMAINQLNKSEIRAVSEIAKATPNIRAISFNFHTPYPGTERLRLSVAEKQACCDEIVQLMKAAYPIFNLKSAFPYLVENRFPTPCHQCVVMENGKISTCGRCVEIEGLCAECGYFFAAEYALLFNGNIPVMSDMMKTYLRYI
ncbi:MAG: radical SAM protein [Culicoidibacterales bacterium]